MNTRHTTRWLLPVLAVTGSFVLSHVSRSDAQSPEGTTMVKTGAGLTVVTFNGSAGTINVNLPDDIRVGDKISGTVLCEPAGTSKEQRDRNWSELVKVKVRLFTDPKEDSKAAGCGDPLTAVLVGENKEAALFAVFVQAPQQMGNGLAQAKIPVHPSGAIITPDPKITVPTTPSGAVVTPDPKITTPKTPSGAVITPDPKITVPKTSSGAVITPDPKVTDPFYLPETGQTGRPIIFSGPFDGDSSNTEIMLKLLLDEQHIKTMLGGGVDGGFAQQFMEDFAKQMIKAMQPTAESPRVAVFTLNQPGPFVVRLSEGTNQTIRAFRIVGVNLTAPKTNLLKGEKTNLTVEIQGLQGLTQPTPLTLESQGPITIEGGTYQQLTIQPSQVNSGGRYITTREVTGVQAGAWASTATIVTRPFNFCLQDDANPALTFRLNSFTGDYSFKSDSVIPLRALAADSKMVSAPVSAIPPNSNQLAGNARIEMKGCVLKGEQRMTDRTVIVLLDPCARSGSVIMENTKTKSILKINDRSTSDSYCGLR